MFPKVPTTPALLADSRVEMVDYARSSAFHASYEAVARSCGSLFSLKSDQNKWLSVVPNQLAASRLWWIGADVCDMAELAAPTLPMDTTLTPELLGDPFGVMAFERAFDSTTTQDEPCMVSVLSWGPVLRATGQHEMWLSVWVKPHANEAWHGLVPSDRMVWLGATQWKLGTDMTTLGDEALPDWRVLLTVLALANSTGITRRSEPAITRATRRRLQRAGVSLDAARVLHLAKSEAAGDGAGSSSYSHRWVVRGHWRSQACGPGRSQRRPVFIAPHIKGPDGAPMLTGPKITSFTRPPK